MESYSIYFRGYANSERTQIQYVAGNGDTHTVAMSQPGVLILAIMPAQLLAALTILAPYGIQKIEYMHPCSSEVGETITSP